MRLLLILSFFISFKVSAQNPVYNQQIIDTAVFYGRTISPTYHTAVCTEYVIGVLGHFIKLDSVDTVNIRIDQPRNSINDVYEQIENGAPEPKGVYYALTRKGVGVPIDNWSEVRKGDFVQFWYERSMGHCGIVDSIDLRTGFMWLHSSYTSTDGYGIQKFSIPDYSWFVRLIKIDESNLDPNDQNNKPSIEIEKPSNRKKKNKAKKHI